MKVVAAIASQPQLSERRSEATNHWPEAAKPHVLSGVEPFADSIYFQIRFMTTK